MQPLDPRDQARLNQILEIAHKLEKTWPSHDRQAHIDMSASLSYQELKTQIGHCANADAESLRRIAGHAAHLHDDVSLTHFCSFIVPFERLANRALRDDEFLVEEGDAQLQTQARVPLKVIVENLRSAFNVGAVFRTSECLGISEILLCGYTPDPESEKTARTAMGTSALVPWRRVNRARTACEELRKDGYKIIALETTVTATSLHEAKFDGAPVAFVLGNERFGLENETLQAVDEVCRIPVRGIKNSMNVGIAFGISAFEWLRQFEKSK